MLFPSWHTLRRARPVSFPSSSTIGNHSSVFFMTAKIEIIPNPRNPLPLCGISYHRKHALYCIPVLIDCGKYMLAFACEYFKPVNEGSCADI